MGSILLSYRPLKEQVGLDLEQKYFTESMNRREFIGWVGVGAIASSLPVAIAACNSSDDTPKSEQKSPIAANSPRSDGFVAIGTVQTLDKEGKILDKTTATEPVLVVRNPDTKQLSAVNPICTHQGCTVEWKADKKMFACPCHGSEFALDGKVIEKPAKKPLASYETKEENGSILVKLS